jgi:hypothetical protein
MCAYLSANKHRFPTRKDALLLSIVVGGMQHGVGGLENTCSALLSGTLNGQLYAGK